MKKRNSELILREDDYRLLMGYVRGGHDKSRFDPDNAARLLAEMQKARVVKISEFPADVVRINSKVKLRSDNSDKLLEIELVTPEKADIRSRKVSVLAPVGTALIGFRANERVNWWVPAGQRTFTIVEVRNEVQEFAMQA